MGSKYIHREVVNGRMTVTQVRWTEENGLHVESLVYAGEAEESEPIADWALPHQFRYALSEAAHIAERRTKK